MLIRKLEKINLKEIMELDKKIIGVHSKERNKMYHEIIASPKNKSYGVYSNTKLVGCIFALLDNCEDKSDWFFYSSPINIKYILCKSPKALLNLAYGFIGNNNGYDFSVYDDQIEENAEVINRFKTKFSYLIKEEAHKTNKNNGKNYTKIIIKRSNSIKYSIRQEIIATLSKNNYVDDITSLFYHLLDKYSLEEIISNKKFILNSINEKNLDFVKMIGKTTNIVVKNRVVLYGDSSEKFIEELEKQGYKWENKCQYLDSKKKNAMNFYDKKYYSLKVDGLKKTHTELYFWNTMTLDDKYYDGSLYYYRHIIKKHIIEFYKEHKSKNMNIEICILDKYGKELFFVNTESNVYNFIPRNHEHIFDYLVNKEKFVNKYEDILKKDNRFSSDCVNDSYLNSGMLEIRKEIGEEFAFEFLERFCNMLNNKEDVYTQIHDWFYKVSELFQAKKYLTKGALEYILKVKSLNQLNKIVDLLQAVLAADAKFIDLKLARKEISKCVKKDMELEPLVKDILNQVEEKFIKSKNLSKKLVAEFNEFISRMQKYEPNITINSLFTQFGTNLSKNIVRGKHEGLFEEHFYDSDMFLLGKLVQSALKEGLVKHPKKLYSSLSKIQNVNDIISGNIEKENVMKIVGELKQRGVNIDKMVIDASKITAKIEKKCSPEFLTAGNASVCCMSYGQEKATTYAKEKGFGIFNIYYNDRVIANSLIWINHPYNCLVIDNIEVHPNYTKYNDLIKALYHKMINHTLRKYNLSYSVQGYSYNDLLLYDNKRKIIYLETVSPRDVKTKNFYSDATNVYAIETTHLTSEKIEEMISITNEKILRLTREGKDIMSVIDINEDEIPLAI